MPADHRFRVVRSVLIVLILSAASLVWAVSEPASDERGKQAFVVSAATVTAALHDAASTLKQTIASIRARTVEAQQALVLAQKDAEELRAETAAIKALLAIQQFPLNRVEDVHGAYSIRASKLAASKKHLMEEIGRLKDETAGKAAPVAQMEQDLLLMSAGKQADESREDLEAAFESYRRLVSGEERELARLIEISEKTSDYLQAEEARVEEILPMLERQRESWKLELLKRQQHMSLKQQILVIWGSITEIPKRASQWVVKLVLSGTVENFARSHPMALSGLVALVALLSWGARRVKHLAHEKLESWKTKRGRPSVQWLIGIGQEAVSQVYPVGLALWLILTLKTLGIADTVPASLSVYGLMTLIAMSFGLGLIVVSYDVAAHQEVKLLTERAGRFYRRMLKLFVAWSLLGWFGLMCLRLLEFPATIVQLTRLLFEAGLLYFVIRMTRPPRVESLMTVIPDARQKYRRWMVALGRARYGLIGIVVVALMAYPLGFQPLSLHLVGSGTLSVGLAAAAMLARWGGTSAIHFFLHADNGWLGKRFPDRYDLLGRLCALAQGSFDVLLVGFGGIVLYTLWGGAPGDLLTVLGWLRFGIPIGSVQLSPLNLILGCIVLNLGFWLSRFSTRILHSRVFPRTGWDIGIQYTISTILQYVILVLGILMALNVLGFPLANLALVMGALGVGIGLGLQNIVSNFFSGLVLLIERPIKVGDMLVIDGQFGEVKEIRIRSTVFQIFDKSVLIIPNSELTASKILNWTHYGRGSSRITLKIGVGYGSDIGLVTRLLHDVCEANGRVLKEPQPQVLFVAYGESALDFSVLAHVATPEDRTPAIHELNTAIFGVFREHDIEIPFPQRDLYIKNWPQGLLKGEV
ncbi:MAG: mechanosensitive ion channel domain-containing protein [Syntrophobacteraceae bacterium]